MNPNPLITTKRLRGIHIVLAIVYSLILNIFILSKQGIYLNFFRDPTPSEHGNNHVSHHVPIGGS